MTSSGRLSEIRAPALVVHGDEDAAIPMERAEALCTGLSGCAGVVVVAGGSYDPGFAGELGAATRGVAGVEFLGSLPRAELWTLMARAAALAAKKK